MLPTISVLNYDLREFEIETAIVIVHVVASFASPVFLDDQAFTFFLNLIYEFVGNKLEERGCSRAAFNALLGPRTAEYSHYKKLIAKEGESVKGTLLWEYTKKVAFITGAGQNALFNTVITSSLLRQFGRWNFCSLIKG